MLFLSGCNIDQGPYSVPEDLSTETPGVPTRKPTVDSMPDSTRTKTSESTAGSKTETKTGTKTGPNRPDTRPETKPVTKPETKPETKPVTKPETKPETKTATKPETKTVTKPETKTVTRPATKTVTKQKTKTATKTKTKTKTQPDTRPTTVETTDTANPGDQNNPVFSEDQLSFAVEIETGFVNSQLLQYYYRPQSIPLDVWKRATHRERVRMGYEACSPKDYDERHDEFYEFIPDSEVDNRKHIAYLPPTMACDWPGTPEINDVKMNNIGDYTKFLTEFLETFGPCGNQGHVVFPRKYFSGMLGYQLYESDRSMLRRTYGEYDDFLRSGHADINNIENEMAQLVMEKRLEFLGNYLVVGELSSSNIKFPDWMPGAVFRAEAVGPIKNSNWEYYKSNISLLKRGEPLRFETTGFGKVGAPNLRETYVQPGLIGYELRMEDNPAKAPRRYEAGVERLIEATKRLVYLLTTKSSLSMFSPLETTHVPKAVGWRNFLRLLIERIDTISDKAIKAKSHERVVGLANLIRELNDKKTKNFYWENWNEFFYKQNFLFPLRDWDSYHIVTQSAQRQRYVDTIYLATITYLNTVVDILQTEIGVEVQDANGILTRNYTVEEQLTINAKMQIAASRWVFEVDLFPAFREYEEKNGVPAFDDLVVRFQGLAPERPIFKVDP